MNFARNERGILERFLSPVKTTAQKRDANTGNNNDIINRNIKIKLFFKDKTKRKNLNHNFRIFHLS